MISYRIQSKILNKEGKPDFVKFGVTKDFEYTVKFHVFHLRHRTHPDPQLMKYTESRSVDCLEFIADIPTEKQTEEIHNTKPRKKKIIG